RSQAGKTSKTSVVIIIRMSWPPVRDPAKRYPRIDVAIEGASGRGRHALGIGLIRTVARNPYPSALDAPGIVVRGHWSGQGQRDNACHGQSHDRQHKLAHVLSPPRLTNAWPLLQNHIIQTKFSDITLP